MSTPSEDHRFIPLTKNQYTIVDAADYEWLSQWKWRALPSPPMGNYYAIRTSLKGEGEKRHVILMHRVILNLKNGDELQGDHINGDSLDNRRKNLRKATGSQNSHNQKLRSDNTSGYKGVSLHAASGLYIAKIMTQGKLHCLGYRKTAVEAHALYRAAASELCGQFTRTN